MFAPALFAILILANITEAITGFGSTVIALTLGSFFFPLDFLVTVLVPLNLVLSLSLVTLSATKIDWKILARDILPMTGLGMAIGLWWQKSLQSSVALQKGYGAFVFGFAVFKLFFQRRPYPLTWPRKSGLLLGGGIMQGIYASGGPLVVSCASQILPDKDAFRATLSFLWILLNGLLFGMYLQQGVYTEDVRWFAFKHLPAVLIGMVAGNTLHRRIDQKSFQRLVFFLLMLAGLALVLR